MIRDMAVGTFLIALALATTSVGAQRPLTLRVPAQSDVISGTAVAGQEALTKQAAASTNLRSIRVLFDKEERGREIREGDAVERVNVEIITAPTKDPFDPLKGKRIYGSRELGSVEDWIEATTSGIEIELQRTTIKEEELSSLKLRIKQIQEIDSPVWSELLTVIAITHDGVESLLFAEKEQDRTFLEWDLPALEPLTSKGGNKLERCLIKLVNLPEQQELTLKVMHGPSTLGNYTISESWQQTTAALDGVQITLNRFVNESKAHLLILCIQSNSGKLDSNLEAEVIGMADDQVESLLVPQQPGTPVADEIRELENKKTSLEKENGELKELIKEHTKQLGKLDKELKEIKTQLLTAIGVEREQLKTQMELIEETIQELKKTVAESKKKSAKAVSQIKTVNALIESRTALTVLSESALYWEFTKIE